MSIPSELVTRFREFLEPLQENPRLQQQLRSSQCNVKALYWELPAHAAPRLAALAKALRGLADENRGWIFLQDLLESLQAHPQVVVNVLKLVSLLQNFGYRLIQGKLICSDAARNQLLQRMAQSGFIPGPAENLRELTIEEVGRPLEDSLLAALLSQTLTPGVSRQIAGQLFVFSTSGLPSTRQLALGALRSPWSPATPSALKRRLQQLGLEPGSDAELEMELHGLVAEGLAEVEDSQFRLCTQPANSGSTPGLESLPEFAHILFQSLFRTAVSDSLLASDEVLSILHLLALEFNLPHHQLEAFEGLLAMAMEEGFGWVEMGDLLQESDYPKLPQELRDRLLRACAAVAIADGRLCLAEETHLQQFAQQLATSLPAHTLLRRYREINEEGEAALELIRFGILPDQRDPAKLRSKMLQLDEFVQEGLKIPGPIDLQRLERVRSVLAQFEQSQGFETLPWLLSFQLGSPPLPQAALLPLHFLLRIGLCDGPLQPKERTAIHRLVLHLLPAAGPARALWNLGFDQHLTLPPAPDELPDQPIRLLSWSLLVALSDGPLNVEESKELLALAHQLGVSETAFQILHQLEQTMRHWMHPEPNWERLEELEEALEPAEEVREEKALEDLPTPLVLPHLESGQRPFLMVIRPSGRKNFVIHLRPQSELTYLPPMQKRLQEAIQANPLLHQLCQGRSWFLCQGIPLCLKILESVRQGPFQVHWPQGQPFQVLGKASFHNLKASLSQAEGWFQIGGKLQLGPDYEIDLLELLQRIPAQDEAVALDATTYFQVDDTFRQQLLELRQLLPEGLPLGRLDPLRARLIAGHTQLFEDHTDNQEFSRLAGLLEEARQIQPDLPESARQALRDYQAQGLFWMLRNSHAGLGICLADDMGLGKTLQTLCLLYHRRRLGTSLVVAPTSVTYNWKEQAQQFLPEFKVLIYEGSSLQREKLWQQLPETDLLVVSYGIMQKESLRLQNFEWNCLVLDEAQKIKNPTSATARSAFQFKARARIATTGTPVENHLQELWSLMHFLNPGLLGTLSGFQKLFARNAPDPSAVERLRHQISYFVLRRRKEMVAPQLPAKQETVYRIDLQPEERKLYNQIRRQALKASEKDRISLLSALTRLRQACCDPGLLQPEWGAPSSKLQSAMEMLHSLVEEGHRVLVFSQFVSLLKRLSTHLEEDGMNFRSLYGSTSIEERRENVRDFQAGHFPVFLISLKAGGTGLTLTRAGYVIHLDPWWNPAVEDQATDRAHRLGQHQVVHVYRLIARETVEEKVLELHQHKRELARAVLDDEGVPNILTVDELKALL